ncbi:Kelch repeat-containing protein [Streptomyces sp. NPDC086023]|uniref:Kelch repeat-containing protein n=1 Tax=Streptomyces sp. NPDC086023 TaxID=3365746 RepID=UPI0037CF2798
MRTPPPAPARKKWRKRLAVAAALAAAAVLAGMLPAAASNGTIWTTLPNMPTARNSPASAAAPCPPGQTGTCVYTVGGYDGTSDVGIVESYNRLTNAWSTLPPLPSRRSGVAAAAAPCPSGQTGTCIYAVGGAVRIGPDYQYLRVVESYNPVTNAWSTVAPLTTNRGSPGVATAPCPVGQTGTCVYAIGGYGPGGLASAESYNPANNSWSTIRPMNVPRHSLGAAAAACPPGQTGTCIYAVGGMVGFTNAITGAVESYNPATNAWSPVASIPTARASSGVTATACPPGQSGTCVYVVGGGTPEIVGNVDSYNPATNAWTALPSLPRPRHRLAAAATTCPPGMIGSCVYASGGSLTSSDATATFEALDPPDAVRAAEPAEQPQED